MASLSKPSDKLLHHRTACLEYELLPQAVQWVALKPMENHVASRLTPAQFWTGFWTITSRLNHFRTRSDPLCFISCVFKTTALSFKTFYLPASKVLNYYLQCMM